MADPYDLLTYEEAKSVVRYEDNAESTELAAYVTAVSHLIDQWAGPTVARTVTNEAHDGGRPVVVLHHRPVTAVATIVEWDAGAATTITRETTGTVPDNGYTLVAYKPDPTLFNGFVRRRLAGFDHTWACGDNNVLATYTAGRCANTAAVPERFKRAAGIVLENLWRDRQPGVDQLGEYDVPHLSFPTFAMPRAVRELLKGEVGTGPALDPPIA